MRLDFTSRFDDVAVKGDLGAVRATSQGTITIRAIGETQLPEQSRGLLRHLASTPPGFGHVPNPPAVAEHDAAPTVTLIYLPVQGPCRQTSA
jgi:hypothetical protein